MIELCTLMFVGPCVFAALTLFVAARFLGEHSGLHILSLFAVVLLLAQVVAAGGCAALCRWCFPSAPVRGAALLSALLVSLGLLSTPTFGMLAQSLVTGDGAEGSVQQLLLKMAIESAIFLGLTLFAVMFCVLTVELPVRWALGDRRFLEDGLFRAMRCAGSLFVLSVGGALIEEEGISRLLRVLKHLSPY